MCTRTQDRKCNPARSDSRTSLAKVPATCVQDARIGYIQDVLVFETLRIIIEPMAGSVPPVGRHHSHARLPHRPVPHTHHIRQDVNILQWYANGISNKQTELSTDSLVIGDFNAHHSLWHSGTTDTRGNQLAVSVNISSFAVLNTDSPTRLPGNSNPSSPDVSLALSSLITSSNGKYTRQ